MKPHFSFLLISLLLLGAPMAAPGFAAEEEKPANASAPIRKKALPSVYVDYIKKGDYAGLQNHVLIDIKGMDTRAGGEAGNEKWMLDPSYRHLIALAELLRVTGAENLSKFQKENAHGMKFLGSFLSDPSWLERYLGAGLVPENTDNGLKVMADIWKKHGQDSDFKDFLSLTCGLASIWGAGETGEDFQMEIKLGKVKRDPVWRYEFFRKQEKAGKLYPGFLKLRPWEIRYVAAHNWDDESYQWMADKVNLPPRKFVDAWMYADYTGTNFFGDSIQGPLFHMPWREETGMAENIKKRGAVCGGLSTLGQLAANSHGIPALTVGQTGHCAFAIRLERGDWRGGFGGPDGFLGNNIFGRKTPTSRNLMESVFADDETIDRAYRYSFRARALEQLGDTEGAIKAWEQALAVSPLHKHFREELHRLYKEHRKMDAKSWQEYARTTLPSYKGHGYAYEEIIEDAQNVFFSGLSGEEKLAWLRTIQEYVADTPVSRSSAVKCGDLLERQMALLDSDELKTKLLADTFAVHLNKGDGTRFGQCLEWSINNLVQKGKEKVFSDAFAIAAKTSGNRGKTIEQGGAELDKEKLKKYYKQAIAAAELAGSVPAFQALVKETDKLFGFVRSKKTFKSDPLPGTLVSPECMVQLSTAKWDDPLEHYGVLNLSGGKVHTDKEENPSITVSLPRTVKLSGILVTKLDRNQERMKKVRISTSTDGATWFPLEETKEMPGEWRIEDDKGTEAKWVRIEALNDKPEHLHLKHILIYQK